MKPFQKRKDAPLVVLYIVLALLSVPFVYVAAIVELVIKETLEMFEDFPDQIREGYQSEMANQRYRRAARQAKRNNPELNWD